MTDVETRARIGDRYELVHPLGRGGMGVVWRARDTLLDRSVAIKEVLPPPGLTDDERAVLREHTLREARAAARIRSAGAVTVYDVVEQDGRPWIVMELLEARTLAETLRDDGPLEPARAAAVGLAVLDALEAAHRAGVVHRDVKPANVLLAADGRVVLTDFGVAALDGDPTLAATGTVLGSPAYMAPERLRGKPPSPPMDLWSLGATLYAAVEGASPFVRRDAIESLDAVLHAPIPTPQHAGPLAPVLEGLLQRDPAARLDIPRARALLERALRQPAEGTQPVATVAPTVAAPASAERVTAVVPPAAARETRPASPVAAAPPPPPVRSAPVRPAPVRPAPVRPAPAARPATEGARRRWPLALVAGLIVAALAGGLFLWIGQRDSQVATAAPPAQSARGSVAPAPVSASASATASSSASASQPASPSASSSPTPRSTPRSTPTESSATPMPRRTASSSPTASETVPGRAGFTSYRDPTGFALLVPSGWTHRVQDGKVYFEDPQSSRFFHVDQTTSPKTDALRDWQENEQYVSQRFPGYQRISLRRVDYRDYNAADWEFRWTPSSGNGVLHVLSRNMITDPGRQAYAIYLSSPEGEWAESEQIFAVLASSFQPRS